MRILSLEGVRNGDEGPGKNLQSLEGVADGEEPGARQRPRVKREEGLADELEEKLEGEHKVELGDVAGAENCSYSCLSPGPAREFSVKEDSLRHR